MSTNVMSTSGSARPILFSSPMVRALLDGRKTQTRRVMKTPPVSVEPFNTPNVTLYGDGGKKIEQWFRFPKEIDGYLEHKRPAVGVTPTKRQAQRSAEWIHSYHQGNVWWSIDEVIGLCPYGKPGDRMWVREAWKASASMDSLSPKRIGEAAVEVGYKEPWAPLTYLADGQIVKGDVPRPGEGFGRYRHARFMPRWASRITLEITEVRVQRLQDISAADCFAEGIIQSAPEIPKDPQIDYQQLWESINGAGSWDANPWVWALTFRAASTGDKPEEQSHV